METSIPREALAMIAAALLYFAVVQVHAYLGYPVYG
jgi:hypothetical protein